MNRLMDIDPLWPFPGLGWSSRAEILTQLIETESTSTLQGVAKQSLKCNWETPDAGGTIPVLHAQRVWCKMPRLEAAAVLVLLSGSHHGADCMLGAGWSGTGQLQHPDSARAE